MHDSSVILCEPFLHFLLPSGMMDKTDGRDGRMAQYYMLYKPRGLLTAKRDARRETVMSCFPEALREMLHPVGRLDRDTEGLLLFTFSVNRLIGVDDVVRCSTNSICCHNGSFLVRCSMADPTH